MRMIDTYPICDLYPQYQTSLLPITLEIGPRVNVIAKISCMCSFLNLGFTYSVSTHSSHATWTLPKRALSTTTLKLKLVCGMKSVNWKTISIFNYANDTITILFLTKVALLQKYRVWYFNRQLKCFSSMNNFMVSKFCMITVHHSSRCNNKKNFAKVVVCCGKIHTTKGILT